MKPTARPNNPCFSSGPCAKRPGWTPAALDGALLGRSHRSKGALARITEMFERSRALLGLPDEWRLALVPASDTGAMEMAMWSMLGARGVDFLTWENFGSVWVTDGIKQLGLEDARVLSAEYGQLPDLSQVDPARDTVFVWNGTTSGVMVPDGDWIADDRAGVTICDATSAVFAYDLPWRKLDATSYSWQKVMGGEAGFGMLVLSPHAVARLESYQPPWPLPKLFRLTKAGVLDEGVFRGQTINTISMLCVEDALDALRWMEQIGGRPGMMARGQANFEAIEGWVAASDWLGFLAQDPSTRSRTSVCLSIVDPWFGALEQERQRALVKEMAQHLEAEGAGYDISTHRAAPPGLRLWAGGTVERADLEALFPWLDWAWATVRDAARAN